jgi:hypothetical protein
MPSISYSDCSDFFLYQSPFLFPKFFPQSKGGNPVHAYGAGARYGQRQAIGKVQYWTARFGGTLRKGRVTEARQIGV